MSGEGGLAAFSPILQALLAKRGIATSEEAELFLNPDYDSQLHDPRLLPDIEKAAERIIAAMEQGEHIAVYADFDCDGIPGAVVLADFFEKIGYDRIHVYIPHRHNEGYGLHSGAIDTLAKRDVSLIITVDLGITAVEEVRYAGELGIETIVTDHHELNGSLPEAVAIVNPKRPSTGSTVSLQAGSGQGKYPFSDLCGAAVAYKLVQVLLDEGRARGVKRFENVPEGWEKWLLDMVGIATIADMVPLVGENRVLAHYGLKVLRKSPRPGLAALLRKLRASQPDLTEDDIGFLIGPRINAASRMDVPELAFRLLSTKDPREAEALAGELEGLNRKRKGAVAATVREVNKRVRERRIDSPVMVLGDPTWRPALLGLAANSVVDARGGIVCLWGRDGAGRLKGSCRSDGSASVVELFQEAEESLEQYGGHHASGGFSVSHEHVHTLQDVFAEAFARLKQEEKKTGPAMHDLNLPLETITRTLYREIARLAPFGIGNPKPLFCFESVTIASMRAFGKANEHLELTCVSDSGSSLKAVQFFADPDSFSAPPAPGLRAHVLGSLEQSVFGGRSELRARLVDILPS